MKLEETEDLGQGVSLKMVLIPEGKFVMGSPYGRFSHESERQHEVTLTKPFYLGIYTVTQEQWEAVMGNNPSEVKEARLPVTDVSWEDCQEFIKKLNEKKNGGYRLPTEAEWEYACRAGTTTAYSVGNRLAKSDANIHGDSIKAVGSYKPNAFGLYDMHGNVWEWCEDWYGDYPAGSVTDPKGPATGERRVFRGGSFVFYVLSPPAHSSDRNFSTPTDGSDNLGFRLARTVDLNEDLDEDLYLDEDEDEDEVLVYDPLNLSEEEEKERASFIAEVEKQCRVRAKELGLPGVEEQELAEGLNLEMVLIPAGKFVMGSPKSEEGRSGTCDETQHEVTLTKPFYMGKYEVTQEQWEAVMGNNPSETYKGPKLPVTHLSWEDCQEFIKKLNEKKNGGYRLPTEAEWEYGCRGGTTTAYSVGNRLTKSEANYDDSKIHKPIEVGSYKPNAFGLYDMHGNLFEWCEDWHGEYSKGAVTDPKGPATGTDRVLRGGSYFCDESIVRSSSRSFFSPSGRISFSGFRLARPADIKDAVAPKVIKPDPSVIIPVTWNLLVAPFTETKTKEVQREAAKSLQKEVEVKEDLGNGVSLEMVLIPAGKFMMGSPASEKSRHKDEMQHEVTLTKSYYMGKNEVTQEQWKAVMGNIFIWYPGNTSSNKGDKIPVTDVSWEDCQEFIKKLNAKTNGGYRLPTEAEWEYGCRAGTTTAYSFGDEIPPKDANYDDSKIDKPVEVGSCKPNAFGLYDMHCNVWEWCEDWHGDYSKGAVTDPRGAATGNGRVLRGGALFIGSPASSSYRDFLTPTLRIGILGFRLARTVDLNEDLDLDEVLVYDPLNLSEEEEKERASFIAEVEKQCRVRAKELGLPGVEEQELAEGINLEMVLIPAGKFVMGSPKSEEGRSGFNDETQHEVTLTKAFYLGKYEVTQEQWGAVMGDNPSSKTIGAKLPVTDVSWEDCQEFIKKLNEKTNGGYRLPTEAEWEYGCRAGTTTAYSVGDRLAKSDANIEGDSIKAVGSYKPNAFGLYDMHGNVWEWCEDWYGNYPEGAVMDPKWPSKGEDRVMRGGSFYSFDSLARSSYRNYITPSSRGYGSGFRLARTI